MIEVKNLSFSFEKNTVISDLSFSIEKGKTYCIMGRSGVGKTTLLRLLAGILKSEKGRIVYKQDVKKSFVFQENRLVPWMNVYDTLKYITKDENAVKSALIETSLYEEKEKMPDELSGGMARRLSIARAIAYGGEVFFIDEPLYGLDVKTSEGILELIKNTLNDKTAIVITHSPEEAFYLSDKIIFLKNSPICEAEIVETSDFATSDEIKKYLLA